MISASKSTLSLNNLKFFRPKVTKNLTNFRKKFCESPPRCFMSFNPEGLLSWQTLIFQQHFPFPRQKMLYYAASAFRTIDQFLFFLFLSIFLVFIEYSLFSCFQVSSVLMFYVCQRSNRMWNNLQSTVLFNREYSNMSPIFEYDRAEQLF